MATEEKAVAYRRERAQDEEQEECFEIVRMRSRFVRGLHHVVAVGIN